MIDYISHAFWILQYSHVSYWFVAYTRNNYFLRPAVSCFVHDVGYISIQIWFIRQKS
jgi:hypothetical protein